MTDIPGTGKITETQNTKLDIPQVPMSVINTTNIKKEDITKNSEARSYDKFRYFLIPGILLSIIFIGLSIKYRRFWVFIPVGPITAIIAWYVRSLLKKLEPKPKRYSH